MTAAFCAKCHKPIFWAYTRTGSLMPVDFKPVEDGNVTLDERKGKLYALVHGKGPAPEGPRYVAHFVTCPFSRDFRKRTPV